MLRKLRPRSIYDVMAAIACFGVLAGGTAYAADTVFSTDIVDNEVFSADVRDDTLAGGGLGSIDIANGEMTTNEIRDDTAAFGGLFAQDLAAGSVGTSEVATNSLTSADIANQSLTVSDIGATTQTGFVDDPAPVGVRSCIVERSPAIAGKTANDLAFVLPPPAFPAGLVVSTVFSSVDTTAASYRVCNVTNAAIDAGSFGFEVLVIAR